MNDRLLFGDSLSDKKVGFSKSKFEQVQERNDPKWDQLNQIPQWRKCLSSLHSHQPLEVEGITFQTPEHYFQYKKFQPFNKNYADKFILGKEFGSLSGKEVRQKGKLCKLTDEEWESWKRIESDCKEVARKAKFQSGNQCYDTLIATCEAQLWSYAPRCTTFRMFKMEAVRDQLRN